MFKPLKGVKVIDLTYFVAGPGAARILADWGADVIKVEPGFGDPGRWTGATMSCPTEKDCNPFYTIYNMNKRGIALNLKKDEGKAILDKILETADVFVSSYRTGALKRLGLDYDSLSKKYPHLIWAQINGFGDFGPAKDNAGFDTVAFWARSGAMIDLTEKDTSPINPLIGFGDATTSCSLAGGISAALYQKAQTGKGCKVMISLFGQAIWSESAGMVSVQYGDMYPKTRLNPGSPVMNTYRSSDGKWFYMSILEPDRYNNKLFEELGLTNLIDDPDYSTAVGSKAHSAELVNILAPAFAQHTMEEIERMFARADIAYDHVQNISEVVNDPQALENKYIVPFANNDGSVTKQPMTPIRFTLTEPQTAEDITPTLERQAPMIGEHTVEVLKEYGYEDDVIRKYIEDGVVTAAE